MSYFPDYAAIDQYMADGFRNVQGWCSPHLADLCKLLDSHQRNRAEPMKGGVAEIGIHHGLFFILLNSLCELEEMSWALDVFEDQLLNIDFSGAGNRAQFTANLKAFDRHGGANVRIVRCDSTTTNLRDVVTVPVRFFSIDGGHTAEHTISDLHAAQNVLHAEGVVILDDILNEHWLGVIEGCIQFLATRPTLVPFAIGHNKLFLCNLSYRDRYVALLRTSPFAAKGNVRFMGWDIVACGTATATAPTSSPPLLDEGVDQGENEGAKHTKHRMSQLNDLVHLGLVEFDFESMLERHYRRWICAGDTVVDIGAHAGRHLEPLLECAGPTGRAYAFEPLPAFCASISARFGEYATVENTAVSDFVGIARFIYARGTPGESGLRQRIFNHPDIADPAEIEVKVETLDNYAKDFDRLSFVKIDIEGGEIGCLRGARATLLRLRPLVSVEYGFPGYGVYGHTKRTLFDLASELNYVLYDLFANALSTLDLWELACDGVSYDWLMVPKEMCEEFEKRMRAPLRSKLLASDVIMERDMANIVSQLDDSRIACERRVADLLGNLSRAKDHAAAMEKSLSWRITAPLRKVRSLFR